MKRSNAKLALMHDSSRTAQMFQFPVCTALLCRQVKLCETIYIFLLDTRRLIYTLQFTRIEYLPFLSRCFQSVRRRLLQWLRLPVPSCYVCHSNTIKPRRDGMSEAGYLLIECIEETQGTMLSNTWPEKQHDVKLRTNFFRDFFSDPVEYQQNPFTSHWVLHHQQGWLLNIMQPPAFNGAARVGK